jgi:hypothetical protein
LGAPSTTLQSFLHRSSRSSYHRRSPRTFPSAVHPPTSFGSPPEFDETVPTTRRFRLGSSSREVSRLIAPSTSQVRRRSGFHATAAVRPQVFTTSRRLAPRYALRACFIPLARPGFSLQGLPPRREPSRLVAATLPSFRYRAPGSLAGDRHVDRIQGLALPESPLRPVRG